MSIICSMTWTECIECLVHSLSENSEKCLSQLSREWGAIFKMFVLSDQWPKNTYTYTLYLYNDDDRKAANPHIYKD